LQVRKDFICFCIGFCFGDADVSEVMQSNKEVNALLRTRVNEMLSIYKQPKLTNDELVNFDTVLSWIVNLQVQAKRNGINTEFRP